jgi:hypothetical protein
MKVVLVEQPVADHSARNNPAMLRESLGGIGVYSIPYFGSKALNPKAVKKNARRLKKTLARIAAPASFSPRSSDRFQKAATRSG